MSTLSIALTDRLRWSNFSPWSEPDLAGLANNLLNLGGHGDNQGCSC